MKIHKHLVVQIISALDEIFTQKQYADKVIQRYLKSQKKWGARDRKFFAEIVYDIVRWERLLAFVADDNNFWKIWAAYWVKQGNELPDWPEIDGVSAKKINLNQREVKSFAIEQAIPDWLLSLGLEELGEDFKPIIQSLNQPAEVYLRTNTLKTNRDKLIETLRLQNVEAKAIDPNLPEALVLSERKNVFITQAFKDGLFEVQDASSQMIAPFLGVEPGHRVVDACAGAGGKSLHLAALMRNKGKIISLDIHDWKLGELKTRARRAGVDVIETRVIDSGKVIKRLAQSADRLLLDVPCSGLGILRRNPDAKWKLSLDEIVRLRELQYQILKNYSEMTKKGGRMVYATCSILPSENERQVNRFLDEQGSQWKLLEQIHLRPDKDGFDGFFGALFERK